MEKGDQGRVRSEIDTQGKLMQGGQTQSAPQFQSNFAQGSARNLQDYGNIMNQYQNAGMQGQDQINQAAGGFGSMAATGGFNREAVRARALAPTRAVFSRAQSELDRSRRLGGASPNFAASQSKLNRDLGYGLSDASVNAEGMIQERMQKGKMLAYLDY